LAGGLHLRAKWRSHRVEPGNKEVLAAPRNATGKMYSTPKEKGGLQRAAAGCTRRQGSETARWRSHRVAPGNKEVLAAHPGSGEEGFE